MKKLDERLIDIFKIYGEDPREALWDCHGTWVAYHAAVERMAAKAGIKFDKPELIVNDPEKKTVVICVSANMGESYEWSFGEVSPANNKNSYPYAMAEKRAKDRVALKLLGMAGLVYSEEEADDFKDSRPTEQKAKSSSQLKKDGAWETIMADLESDLIDVHSLAALDSLRKQYLDKADADGWTPAWKTALNDRLIGYEQEIVRGSLWNEIVEIKTIGALQSFWSENIDTIKSFGKKETEEFTAMKDKMKSDMLARQSNMAAG